MAAFHRFCTSVVASPLVSVVIPAFRHEQFVREAIESVLAQPVALPLEVLIADDASSDGTYAAIQTCLARDVRLRAWRHEENRGAHATLDALIAAAQAPFAAILNSDDRFLPQRLALTLPWLMSGAADLVGTDIALIDSRSQRVAAHWWIDAFAALKAVRERTGDWVATLLAGNVFMTSSNFVFRRRLWEEIGGFRPYRYVLDYDFLLRALIAGARLHWVDAPLLEYRLHDANTIFEKPLAANQEAAALLRAHLGALLALPGGDLQERVACLNEQWARVEGYEIAILRHEHHEALREKEQVIVSLDEALAAAHRSLREMHEIHTTFRHEANRAVLARDGELARRPPGISAIGTAPSGWRMRWRERLKHARAIARRLWQLSAQPLPLRIRRFAELRRWLRTHPEVRVLSFDVFDTLLARAVEPPDRVTAAVARWLAQRLGTSTEHALATRARIVAQLRAEASKAGGDPECHFEAIVPRWVEALTPYWTGEERAELVRWTEATELALELGHLSVKRQALLFLRWAKRQGYRVIAISDMYLGERHLRELFSVLGLGELIDAIYVSSEYQAGKYSGELFEKVLAKEGISAAHMLHVGDQWVSDALAPLSLGIAAAFFDDVAELKRRKRQLATLSLTRYGGVWLGRDFAAVLAARLEQRLPHPPADPYFRYGLEALGPIFSVAMLGLIEQLQANPVQKVFFFARDGFLLQSLYEDARTRFPALPPSVYAYVSRRVAANAAAAEGLTPQQTAIALVNPKQRGWRSICKTFGLEETVFLDELAQVGLRADEPLRAEDVRLAKFLAMPTVQARIRAFGQKARELLFDYFTQIGWFDAPRIACVDIGWNATIQRFVEQAFADRVQHYPYVQGYYFALVNALHTEPLAHGSVQGLILDTAHGSPWERAVMDCEEIFEQAARATHATTLGYERSDDGTIVPLLKSDEAPDRQAELLCNPAIAAIQSGIRCFWAHFLAVQALTGYDFAALRPWALACAERVVVYPTTEEVRLVSALAHTEDFGHDELLALAPERLSWRDWLHPARLQAALAPLAWRYAPLAGRPWLAALARWQHLRRVYRGRR